MKRIIQNTILIVVGMIIGIIWRIPWNFIVKSIGNQNWGSVAEWAGAVGSVIAILAGFYQVKKQNSFNRALKTEECRPKFECHFIFTTRGKDAIILTHDTDIELSSVDFMLKNAGHSGLIEVHNISSNSVYKIAIKLIYDNTNEIFNYSGLQASQKLILIPGKVVQDKKLEKVNISFVTSGNETGYCFYDGSYRYQDDSLKFVHPIYKYKKTNNHEITVNSDMNEKFLTSKDLKNTDYQFNEDEMYKNGIVHHNYSAYEKKGETQKILQEIADNIKDLKINHKE
ncbi:hypothetical protein IMAU10149_01846 [Lactobacillus helveticus]|uniref:hypothetical protein n=1 Tax=Lactobacillus helveticus TaxID=1587 RepID=UPI0015652106|nr:hypothetical protein [Lactobacillus helveticus]NRO85254.1 hypothetical protein [Lactobacillus helveticus]